MPFPTRLVFSKYRFRFFLICSFGTQTCRFALQKNTKFILQLHEEPSKYVVLLHCVINWLAFAYLLAS